jgi:hypothetical protein
MPSASREDRQRAFAAFVKRAGSPEPTMLAATDGTPSAVAVPASEQARQAARHLMGEIGGEEDAVGHVQRRERVALLLDKLPRARARAVDAPGRRHG